MSETPEFSRLIFTSRLSPNGASENLQAKPEERAALVAQFDLLELSALTAQLTLQPRMQGLVKVTGTIHAEYAQACVVTLEPIRASMNLDIDASFLPAEENDAEAPDDLDDETEFYENGRIDLGELVAQQFGVNLDPYPRKPGVALPQTSFGVQAAEEKPHPFAGLAEAVKKGKKQDKSSN